jgi:excisionase family DNA binding protein
MLKSYYTTGELAEICHVSPTTIFRAILSKHLNAATTPGGHFRVARQEVEEFLKKNNIPFPGNQIQTKKVLIVEDNPAELRLYQRALETDSNLIVKTTDSGYEAGFLTQSFKPDLILLDIFLSDADGRQVAKLIRADRELRHTKIVAITGSKSPQDIKEIKALGFDGFIQKPISGADIRKEVRAVLA